METKSRAVMINDITNNISENLGVLTRHGVLSLEDSIKIITTLNNKQCTWLMSNATSPDVVEFLKEVYAR